MVDRDPLEQLARGRNLSREINAQETRKLDARREDANGVWSGLGVLGRIGWSVAAPTLLGALLGATLDKHRPGAHSWTLALLLAGLGVGCASAWSWVSRENDAIHGAGRGKNR